MTVLVEGAHVVLVPPPGASAVLSAQQTRSLGFVLDEAADRTDDAQAGESTGWR
ncbi:MAG: hypothetical protein M3443_11915 [Actinomycetota bacterium]|nr:hypothetical protein [Actinomycetota bacterium]